MEQSEIDKLFHVWSIKNMKNACSLWLHLWSIVKCDKYMLFMTTCVKYRKMWKIWPAISDLSNKASCSTWWSSGYNWQISFLISLLIWAASFSNILRKSSVWTSQALCKYCKYKQVFSTEIKLLICKTKILNIKSFPL
jgi:hypothetical protein